ncbi:MULTISPECIES: hypothetical protein [Novosphingobium]|nr:MULTISPECIES: hypothetical protein [Novosphingobium]
MVEGAMHGGVRSGPSDQRLREIAAHLRTAFRVSDDHDVTLSDLATAVDSPELAEIYQEIRALQTEQVQRLERLLARIADNDT